MMNGVGKRIATTTRVCFMRFKWFMRNISNGIKCSIINRSGHCEIVIDQKIVRPGANFSNTAESEKKNYLVMESTFTDCVYIRRSTLN